MFEAGSSGRRDFRIQQTVRKPQSTAERPTFKPSEVPISTARILITGGAGFIGSALVRLLVADPTRVVINFDNLTYAGNLASLPNIFPGPKYGFVKADICNAAVVRRTLAQFRPEVIIHLAAETHVDRSIDGPRRFVDTNVGGTTTLLEAALEYWNGLKPDQRERFRFLHVSTDEVFGSLGSDGFFDENTPYHPSSPYSASKAAADHLVRAWYRTYGLPVIVTNTCNNYGPYQFPEKLIPLTIMRAQQGQDLPVYGNGENVRDWIYVEDHARALMAVAEQGRVGETYCVGASAERRNIDVVRSICQLLDEMAPDATLGPHENRIRFVTDRPGHDLRYAIDAAKIRRELGWAPLETFETGLRKTVQWYLQNSTWRDNVISGAYRGERLGLVAS